MPTASALGILAVGIIHFTLDSGTGVVVNYNKVIPADVAAQESRKMARDAWLDLCTTVRERHCNDGRYYTMDVDIRPGYCLISVKGERADVLGPRSESEFLEIAQYRCDTAGGVHLEFVQ
jgi:hypothetical protein